MINILIQSYYVGCYWSNMYYAGLKDETKEDAIVIGSY